MAFSAPPTLLAATGFDRAVIMRAAWALARKRAARDSSYIPAYPVTPKQRIAESLSAIWHNARVEAQQAGRISNARMVKNSFVAQQVALYGTTATGGMRRAA